MANTNHLLLSLVIFMYVNAGLAASEYNASEKTQWIRNALLEKTNLDIDKVNKAIEDGEVDVNDERSGNISLLHDAIRQKFPLIAHALIVNKADVNAKSAKGGTPLHVAAWVGDAGSIEELIQYGAKVDESDNARRTPLHIAVHYGQIAAAEILLKGKANVDAKDGDSKTPLWHALNREEIDMAKLLIRHGADIYADDLKIATQKNSICGKLLRTEISESHSLAGMGALDLEVDEERDENCREERQSRLMEGTITNRDFYELERRREVPLLDYKKRFLGSRPCSY